MHIDWNGIQFHSRFFCFLLSTHTSIKHQRSTGHVNYSHHVFCTKKRSNIVPYFQPASFHKSLLPLPFLLDFGRFKPFLYSARSLSPSAFFLISFLDLIRRLQFSDAQWRTPSRRDDSIFLLVGTRFQIQPSEERGTFYLLFRSERSSWWLYLPFLLSLDLCGNGR